MSAAVFPSRGEGREGRRALPSQREAGPDRCADGGPAEPTMHPIRPWGQGCDRNLLPSGAGRSLRRLVGHAQTYQVAVDLDGDGGVSVQVHGHLVGHSPVRVRRPGLDGGVTPPAAGPYVVRRAARVGQHCTEGAGPCSGRQGRRYTASRMSLTRSMLGGAGREISVRLEGADL